MPKRLTNRWLEWLARGLTGGALVLTALSPGWSTFSAPSSRLVMADDLDCYNDKDLYNLPECVERRANDAKQGNQSNSTVFSPNGTGQGQSTGNQSGGGDQGQQSGGQQQSQPQQQPQQSPPQQAQQSQPSDDEDDNEAEVPRGPLTDPSQAVLTLADAGKEATQYASEDGNDKYGHWARTRYERDRTNSASTLGPNVIDSKVWVAKDLDSAKALYKEQSAIKNFPERKEPVQGPNDKGKPTKYGEEFSFETGYYQDSDDKVSQHYRFVMRQGTSVAVLYLFGREDFFLDKKDKGWTGQGDWYTSTIFHRM